jgi:hypothetical protein
MEVKLSSLHHKEGINTTKFFHFKIQIKKRKVYALFDSSSQENLIEKDLIINFRLEFLDHPNPYPLG